MTINELESILQQATTGDGYAIHQGLIDLLEIVRDQAHDIETLKSQMLAVHEAVPQTNYSELMLDYTQRRDTWKANRK